jgi:SAM-dependent methyltransferase
MLRREITVPERGLVSQEDLGRLAGATENHAVRVLVDLDDGFGFRLLVPGVLPEPGKRAVVYAFDTSDEDLFAINAAFNDVFYQARHDEPWPDELQLIEELVPDNGAAVLEICCGAGRTAPTLVRSGNRVTAVDLSAHCIAAAAAADSSVEYRVADATALPFSDGTFDLGFCFENSLGVFFSRRPRVVAELLRVTKKTVALGLREVAGAGDELQFYGSRSGFLEVAQVHDRRSVDRILDAVPNRDRIANRRFVEGAPRPWGGREIYLVLELR